MKFKIAFFFLMSCSLYCMAQSEALPKNEQGKFIYYELVESKNLSNELLKERISSFLKKTKDLKLNTNHGDSLFMATGKFIINKTLLVMSHPSGEITYHLQAEVKADKFRFWLTDFYFIPYQRDRYGNFVAGTTKGVPLENSVGKLNAPQWKEYQQQAAKYARQFAADFKNSITTVTALKTPVEERIIVKKDW